MDLAGFNAKPRRKSVFIRNIEKSRKALNHKTLPGFPCLAGARRT